MATKKKYVYYFGDGRADGRGDMKDLLGGKGAGLAEMTRLGIPVPAGFTITTEACIEFFDNKKSYPKGMWEEALAALKRVEKSIGCGFGDPKRPLLVSVRSGAKASMPGMMDTVLNLGLNDETVLGLIEKSKNERFGYDAYRRFISMFGTVVMGVKRDKFEKALEEKKSQLRVRLDTDLPAEALKEMVQTYKKIVLNETGQNFPEDPIEQLRLGINAVFNSWFGQRAMTYRRLNNIPDTWGTAVNVVAMVFGNLGETSGTGVAFTRDPSTGERRFYGEFLFNAQGEDVVAGIRTPLPIDAFKQKLPKAYHELMAVYKKLEKHYKDMLDIEFTIQEGKLYMLQTRVGKRTAAAAMRIAVEMAKEKVITKETALLRIDPVQLDQLLHPMIDPKAKVQIIAKGLPASPGAAIGKVVFTAEEAQHMAERHERVILVRTETSPEDIDGMHAAEGILTARGGMTSHAAVVARGMGKCCVAGCGALNIDEERKFFTVGDVTVKEGDYITLNGSTGEVILGQVDLIQPELSGSFKTLMGWADAARTLNVRANADTPHDARVARNFGAEGIGLCRTEHMFFEAERILAVREMILAEDAEGGSRQALAKILPMQRDDFVQIFRIMKGLPVTIRLLDPPLHEFLPQTDAEIEEVARAGEHVDPRQLAQRVGRSARVQPDARPSRLPVGDHLSRNLRDAGPRDFRSGLRSLAQETGAHVTPEVMIPLVGTLKSSRNSICSPPASPKSPEAVEAQHKAKIDYLIGTMIELPRAALRAEEIARTAEFFSFGTNDLTQTTFGISRDDAAAVPGGVPPQRHD
ncbi:MAG: pyruvate, phosphate dikinase [Candidatus Manganitrophus sp.]|nr:pyruvate, phosphate dikinase [Candidatus Manganitrophus sp.]